jgi:hypothetical protein
VYAFNNLSSTPAEASFDFSLNRLSSFSVSASISARSFFLASKAPFLSSN